MGEHFAAAATWPLLFSVFVSGGGFEDRPLLAEEPPDPSEQLASEPGGEFVVVVVGGIAMLLLVVAGAVTIFSLCSPTCSMVPNATAVHLASAGPDLVELADDREEAADEPGLPPAAEK